MKILDYIKSWWASRRLFVILDASDNSVTLSAALYRHMRLHAPEPQSNSQDQTDNSAQVFVFAIPEERTYGFTTHIPQEPTQLCTIQYNSRYHSVGFESLCPSVVKMYYDYLFSLNRRYKLYVKVRHTADGSTIFYQLIRRKP